MPYFLMG